MIELQSLCVPRWSAWAPGLENAEQWSAWAAQEKPPVPTTPDVPEIPFIPASLRRRCSKLGKMLLRTSFAALPPELRDSVPSVFASQGGESLTTLALLEQIAVGELSSPMKFSLSVHNASAGLFSMAAKNQLPSTTIAAGRHTFAAGLLESVTKLQTEEYHNLLFSSGDELLPVELSNSHVEMKYQYGSAFLLSREPGEYTVRFKYAASSDLEESFEALPQPFRFIQWFLSDETLLTLPGSGFELHCYKESKGYGDAFQVVP